MTHERKKKPSFRGHWVCIFALLPTVLGLNACSRATTPTATAPSSAELPERYVLIRASAHLYTAPDPDAVSLNPYANPDNGAPPGTPGFVHVFRWLGLRGDWVEIETLGYSSYERHCEGDITTLRGFRLRLYINKKDVVLSTSRETHLSYPDGTSVTLAAGLPMWPDHSTPGLYTFRHHSFHFALPVPDDHVNVAYAPTSKFELPKNPARMVSNQAVQEGALAFGGTGRIRAKRFFSIVAVVSEEPTQDGVIATIPRGCTLYRVLLQPEQIVDISAASVFGVTMEDKATSPLVPPDTLLFWTDGKPAGVTSDSVSLGTEIDPQGGRRCFQKPLRFIAKDEVSPRPDNFAQLCVDADKVH